MNDDTINEWDSFKVIIPDNDYDEDDAVDELIAKREKRKRTHTARGIGLFGTM